MSVFCISSTLYLVSTLVSNGRVNFKKLNSSSEVWFEAFSVNSRTMVKYTTCYFCCNGGDVGGHVFAVTDSSGEYRTK